MPRVQSIKLPLSLFVALLMTLTTALAVPAAAMPAHIATSGTSQTQAAVRAGISSLGPTLSVSSQLDQRRYAASGDRAYEIGSEDGRYPAMGFHTRGEMGGI